MNEATTLMTFWDTLKDGKISIDNYNFKLFLEGNNFIKSKPNPQSTFNLIRKNGIFLNIVDEYEIKDFVMEFILSHNFERTVFNLVTSRTSLFKRDYLSMLKTETINILRDDAETCYLFYKNGVLEVTKENVKLKDYKEYNLNVWKDQIIDREYSECDHHDSEYRTLFG
jgi:hypothetical protein